MKLHFAASINSVYCLEICLQTLLWYRFNWNIFGVFWTSFVFHHFPAPVVTGLDTRFVLMAVSATDHSPRHSNSTLPSQHQLKMFHLLGLLETPFLFFTTSVRTNCASFLCLCHRPLCCQWWWWKQSPSHWHANSQAVMHTSIISGEICRTWKKSSLMCSRHWILDYCQTLSQKQIPTLPL